jgi:ABC-type Na+ transport system ATPase subunit NatA
LLTLDSVTKRYRDGTVAVEGLSLLAEPGVLGLLGPNGAGKTTLLQMVATVSRPTAGRIVFDGVDAVADPDAVRRRLGYLPQDFGVYETLTAEEMLTYFAALKGVRSRARVHELLERVNLHAVARRRVGGFSGGMRQRLGIAQALINDPDLVIVDEPTAGLDPEERLRFRHLLGARRGGAVSRDAAHRFAAVVTTDLRLRIRQTSTLVVFLLLSALPYLWVPDPAGGRAVFVVDGRRVIYDSAALGLATAVLCSVLLGLAGYYLVSNSLARDLRTRCGYVIASTPVGNLEYLTAKVAGNFAFLATLGAGFMACSMAIPQVLAVGLR